MQSHCVAGKNGAKDWSDVFDCTTSATAFPYAESLRAEKRSLELSSPDWGIGFSANVTVEWRPYACYNRIEGVSPSFNWTLQRVQLRLIVGIREPLWVDHTPPPAISWFLGVMKKFIKYCIVLYGEKGKEMFRLKRKSEWETLTH